jgi:mRNA interferase RelE/StbE
MLKLNLSKRAAKFLDKLPPKQFRQVDTKMNRLLIDPYPPDSSALKGRASNYRRADIGEYRIVYRVNGDTLEVILIGKRNDDEVYKAMERML